MYVHNAIMRSPRYIVGNIQQVHVHACLNPHKYRAESSLERLPQELTPQAAGGWVFKNSNYFGRVGSLVAEPQGVSASSRPLARALHSRVLREFPRRVRIGFCETKDRNFKHRTNHAPSPPPTSLLLSICKLIQIGPGASSLSSPVPLGFATARLSVAVVDLDTHPSII